MRRQGTGTNHGVELREDLVRFSRTVADLGDSAQFLAGNALCLDPASAKGAYDRVYCGAGCSCAAKPFQPPRAASLETLATHPIRRPTRAPSPPRRTVGSSWTC